MNVVSRDACRSLAARRIAFVATIAGTAAALEIVTLRGAHLALTANAGEPSWMAHPVVPVAVAAVLVSGVAALLGRYLFFLPLAREQARLATREKVYRLLAQDAADLILEIDAEGSQRVVAGSLQAVLGDTRDAPSLINAVHADDRAALHAGLEALRAGSPRAEMTIRLRQTTCEMTNADVRLHRLDEGHGVVKTFVTIRDVSARHREAEELRGATIAAQAAMAEAERANAAKTEFLACMSHEIRTPLHSIIGFASLMMSNIALESPARVHAERIQGAGNALLTIVDDILDFSRVEAGALTLEDKPFSLASLVDECVWIAQQSAVAKNLSFHVIVHDRVRQGVRGDQARLRQVLLNLLNNAVKFTEQGCVLLEIRNDREATGDDHIRFAVIDSGIGIAREDLPRLFHRFQQLDGSIRRLYGGTGLGLAICRKLVELMGGQITVASERGIGSAFILSVPLPPASLPAAEAVLPTAPTLHACDILLVEDVPINQHLALQILEAGRHRVDVVGNGAEAVMAVQDKAYDLVLMDLQMPHVDGLTATRMIRTLSHPCRTVPIVAMTANVLPGQAEAALAAGMADVLHKPFGAGNLLSVLDRVLDAGSSRVAPSPTPARDQDALAKLVSLLGDRKVKELLAELARELGHRFAGDASIADDRATLRRQAHATIAGSGMLGFLRLATTCRDYETAEDEGIEARTAALRGEVAAVIATAQAMAAGLLPLSERSIAEQRHAFGDERSRTVGSPSRRRA